MSLNKKDVRLKICVDAHLTLISLAEFHEKDISEYGALLLERVLLGEGHAVKVQAERVARWGLAGQRGELPGQPGDSQGKRGLKAVR